MVKRLFSISSIQFFVYLWYYLLMSLLLSNRMSRAGIIPRVPFLFKKNFSGKDSVVPVRVITDIDDTVKSSGGVRLFGIALGGIDVSQRL